jgi:hypothetical protein
MGAVTETQKSPRFARGLVFRFGIAPAHGGGGIGRGGEEKPVLPDTSSPGSEKGGLPGATVLREVGPADGTLFDGQLGFGGGMLLPGAGNMFGLDEPTGLEAPFMLPFTPPMPPFTLAFMPLPFMLPFRPPFMFPFRPPLRPPFMLRFMPPFRLEVLLKVFGWLPAVEKAFGLVAPTGRDELPIPDCEVGAVFQSIGLVVGGGLRGVF